MRAFAHRFSQIAPAAASAAVLLPFSASHERSAFYKAPSHCADGSDAKPLPRHLIRKPETLHKFWSRGSFEDRYQIEDQIGLGAFGVVYKARLRGTDTHRAVKIIKKFSNTDEAMLQNEIMQGIYLDHPHIVKLIRYFDEPKRVLLVFELCTGPDLGEALLEACKSKQHHMSEYDAAIATRHMLKALNACHGRYVGHYDVKPRNFMYRSTDRTNLKMIDMGLSSGFDLKTSQLKGTYDYLAPEIYRGITGPEADVWACGVIFFTMLTGEPFFTGDDDSEEALKRLTHDRQFLRGRLDFAKEHGISADAHSLLSQMLMQDRHLRITVARALEHPLIVASYATELHDPVQQKKAFAVLEGLEGKFRELSAQPILKRAAKLLMAHIVGQLDDMYSQRLAFRWLDHAGNGELSIGAFEIALGKLNVEIPGDIDSLFSKIDNDGDGYITFLDICAATMTLGTRKDEANIKAMFKLLDRNGDGFIDAADLIEALGCQSAEEIETCRDALEEIPAFASGEDAGSISFFLPKKLNGVPVLKSQGGGKFLVDNSKLKAEAPFLAFRRSKKLDDRVTDIVGPEWGSVLQAEDAGEWIKVQQKVNRLSYKAFVAHICDKDANQSKNSTKR